MRVSCVSDVGNVKAEQGNSQLVDLVIQFLEGERPPSRALLLLSRVFQVGILNKDKRVHVILEGEFVRRKVGAYK